jgi:hypothetical protein
MINGLRSVLLAVIFALLGSNWQSAVADDDTNPVYTSWAKHKIGTVLRTRTVGETDGEKVDVEYEIKLLKLADDKLSIESTRFINIMGTRKKDSTNVQVIKAKNQTKPRKGAEETITIDGKDYKCTIVESTVSSNADEYVSKIWFCDDMPGTIVKRFASITVKKRSSESTMSVQSVQEGKDTTPPMP